MNNEVKVYLCVAKQPINRPLSRRLRGRAAALFFGEKAFSFAPEDAEHKPRLQKPEDVFFNVTHTKNLYLCAFAPCEIGIDAEIADRAKGGYEKIARRFFTAQENAYVSGQESETARKDAFFSLWVRKEAAAKKSGEGLRAVMRAEPEEGHFYDLAPLLLQASFPGRVFGSLCADRADLVLTAIPFSAED